MSGVVGSGVSGLTAAYALTARARGGAVRARADAGWARRDGRRSRRPAGPVAVDTGFIVYNEPTYPRLVALFARARRRRPSRATCRSASACRRVRGRVRVAWRSAGFFAQRGLGVRPGYLRMFAGHRRGSTARPGRSLDDPEPSGRRWGTSSTTGGFGAAFRDHFLVPITAAVWSTAPGRTLEYPVDYLLRFLDNHGLIGAAERSRGGRSRVDRGRMWTVSSRRCRRDAVRSGDPVTAVLRDDAGVTVRTDAGTSERFDAVVMATHADVARRLLGDADPGERRALDGFDYNRNEVVLHTDARVMPRRRAAWASWNVDQVACDPPGRAVTMTYHMNRLQALPGPVEYFVSVNPGDRVRDERVIVERAIQPPALHVPDARRASRDRRAAGPSRHLVRGRALGYGFHEDGCRSGLRGGRADRGGRAGAARHEVAPPRGHRPPSARRARSSTPWSTTSTTWRSTSRARRGRPAAAAAQPEPSRTPGVPRRRPLAGPGDRPADVVLEHLRGEGEDPTGWRITLVTNLRGLRLRLQSGQLLPVPRRGRRACASSSSRCTTRTGSATSTRCVRAAADGPFVASMAKEFYVSPFIDMEGRYTVHVAGRPGHLRSRINERQDEAAAARDQPGPAAAAADRPDARSGCWSATRSMTHRTIALIHWHALRLWRRGIPFQRHGVATDADDPPGASPDDAFASATTKRSRRARRRPGRARATRRARGRRRIRVGSLTVVLPDGAGGSSATWIRAARPRSMSTTTRPPSACCSRGETGAGEAYMDGLWSRPDLVGAHQAGGPATAPRWR